MGQQAKGIGILSTWNQLQVFLLSISIFINYMYIYRRTKSRTYEIEKVNCTVTKEAIKSSDKA